MRSLEALKQDEDRVLISVSDYLGDTKHLVDDVSDLYERIFALIGSTNIQLNELQSVAFMHCLQALRFELLMGCLTLLRGHVTDSSKDTRRAIEIIAFAFEIFGNAESGKRWMEIGVSRGSMKRYLSRFQAWQVVQNHEKQLSKDLVDLYEQYCLYVHPSYGSMVQQASLKEDRRHVFEYFETQNDRQLSYLALSLFRILDTHIRIIKSLRDFLESNSIKVDFITWDQTVSACATKHFNERARWKSVAEELCPD